LILASEDIGLADPMGLVVAAAAMQSFEFVGLPEGVYPLVEATLYLATAPKSNSAVSYFKAYKLLEERGKIEVPNHLRDASRDRRALGHGRDYVYPHDQPEHHVGQGYMPPALWGTYFYSPSDQGYEKQVQDRLDMWRTAQRQALGIESTQIAPDLSEAEVLDTKRRHGRSKAQES
jgi:putative ATPase